MSFCQSPGDSIKPLTLRKRLKRALQRSRPPGAQPAKVILTGMADNLRRAGERLKIVANMNRWPRSSPPDGLSLGPDAPRRCHLLDLPTELILEIISHLSLLPEASLALTCKRLHMISGGILESKSLHFNRDFAPLFHHYRNGHSLVTPRWQFINLLENSRWRACSRCLKLHPRGAYSARELKRKSEDRICNLGSMTGIVDLCPCKKLTYRDKLDLIDLLKVRQQTVPMLASQTGPGVPERFCWHSCTENYGSTELKVALYPQLDTDDRLSVKTEYYLTTGSGQLGKEEHMTPRFGCAHRSVDLWLSSVCQTTVCGLYDSYCASCKRISVCNSCNATLKCPRKQPCRVDNEAARWTYFFWTERDLGGPTPMPDGTWAAQRIHPAESMIDVDNCSELCPWTVREHPPLNGPPALGMDILDPGMQDQSMNQLYSSINMM